MHATEKRLNEMNRLEDMLHFPAAVNAGATLNVLLTIAATWWVAARYPSLPFVWVAAVLTLNLLPVVLMRALRINDGPFPAIPQMDFFRDQHRFSNWVYLAASANMTFWILAAWTLSLTAHRRPVFYLLELAAILLTFMPVLLRPLLKRA